MKKVLMLIVLVLVAASSAVIISASNPEKPAAVFESENTLLQPVNYREWVFVGSSLGLGYAQNPEHTETRNAQLFHNVYIDPKAYKDFAATGKFPEGTVMILELTKSEVKKEPGLQGQYEGDYVALEASVKDSKRFQGGWAYFNFTESPGKFRAKAQPFPQQACWSCHNKNAATDHVFTQFYPVLRAVAPKQ